MPEGKDELKQYIEAQEAQKGAFDNLSNNQKKQGETLEAILAAVTGGEKGKKPKPESPEPSSGSSPQPRQGKPRKSTDLGGYVKRDVFDITIKNLGERMDTLRDNLDDKEEALESFRDSLQEAKDLSRRYTDAAVNQMEANLTAGTDARLQEFAGVANEFVNDFVSDAKTELKTRIDEIGTRAELAKTKAEDVGAKLDRYKKDIGTSSMRTGLIASAAAVLLAIGGAVAVAASKNQTVNIEPSKKVSLIINQQQADIRPLGVGRYVLPEDNILYVKLAVPFNNWVELEVSDVDDMEAIKYLGQKDRGFPIQGDVTRRVRVYGTESWADSGFLAAELNEYKLISIKKATDDKDYARREVREDDGGRIFYKVPEDALNIHKPAIKPK